MEEFRLQRIRWPGDDKDTPHDFRVLQKGKPVGRIYRRNAHGESWAWSIYGGVSGLADTCEGAQAALKAAWEAKDNSSPQLKETPPARLPRR